MAISTNPKPTIYRNLYEITGHGGHGMSAAICDIIDSASYLFIV